MLPASFTRSLLAAACLTSSAMAQGAVPSAHFGRDVYPRRQPEARFALSSYRFTEFDGTGQKFSSKYDFSAGFNFGTFSITDNFLDYSGATYTVSASPGWSGNEPSAWLQNQYLHGLRKLDVVPVGALRDEVEYALGGELNVWLSRRGRQPNLTYRPAVIGVGLATSSIFSEAYVHLGIAAAFSFFTHSIQLRGLVRQSWPQEGDAFREVATSTTLWQGTLALVPLEIHSPQWLWWLLGNPSIGFTLSQDSGIFLNGAADPIEIQFLSFHVEWATGLRIETYNDLPNDTDHGPSFGLAISYDLATLFEDLGSRL